MEKEKNCVKDIYIWLDGGREKACSVKCNNEDIQKLLNGLESQFEKMFTYSESYKVFYGESRLEKALENAISKIKRLLKRKEKENLHKELIKG